MKTPFKFLFWFLALLGNVFGLANGNSLVGDVIFGIGITASSILLASAYVQLEKEGWI